MGFDPNEYEAWFNLEELYLWLSEWDEASARDFQFELDPDFHLIRVQLRDQPQGILTVYAAAFIYVHFKDSLKSFSTLTLPEAFTRLENILCPNLETETAGTG